MKTHIILLGLLLAAPIAAASSPPTGVAVSNVNPWYGVIQVTWDNSSETNELRVADPTYTWIESVQSTSPYADWGYGFWVTRATATSLGWDCSDPDDVINLRAWHQNNDGTDHSTHVNISATCSTQHRIAISGVSVQKVGDNVHIAWEANVTADMMPTASQSWELSDSLDYEDSWEAVATWDWDPGAYPNREGTLRSYDLPMANYTVSDASTQHYFVVSAYLWDNPYTACIVPYKLDGALYGCGSLAPPAPAVTSAAACTQDAGGLGSCEPSGWWAFAGPGAVFGVGLIVVFAALDAIKGGKGKK